MCSLTLVPREIVKGSFKEAQTMAEENLTPTAEFQEAAHGHPPVPTGAILHLSRRIIKAANAQNELLIEVH
jgi:hypothetical protein